MRKLLAVVALLALVPFAGCKKDTPPPAPPSPPPVVPATPPPAPPPAEVPEQVDEYSRIRAMASDEIDRLGLVKAIYFDYDSSDLREADRRTLTENAEALKRFDFIRITIEGHADERGTVDYNLALGDRRARAAFDYLVSLGVAADRMKTVSYGKEVPVCTESNEGCWSRNRRAHFAVTGKAR